MKKFRGVSAHARAGRHCIRVLLLLAICASASAKDLQITHVTVAPQVIVQRGEASIGFRINQPATTTVKIYDARDLLVWRQVAELPAGEHRVQWPALDGENRPVPPEAYFYVIEATASDGERVVYDLTDATGGESRRIEHIVYDAARGKLGFTAPALGRYFIRAGISQTFAVNTLLNNGVLSAGEHEISWDGFDASHLFSVAQHPKLELGGFGYRLSDNAIVVAGTAPLSAADARVVKWPASAFDTERRQKTRPARDGIDPGFYRSVERNRDVLLQVATPPTLKKNGDGVPILTGATPIRVELTPADAEAMETQRGEMVFFWGNQLIYDNEVSYYPYTFNWRPPVLDGQVHLLTGLVVGFGGNLAMATIRVQLGDASTLKEAVR